jgi:hypothetical protein
LAPAAIAARIAEAPGNARRFFQVIPSGVSLLCSGGQDR